MEKKDIALQQLVDSAKLYEKGHYASALTLAGAAEEIFGKIAKEKVGANQHINQPCPPKKDLIAEIDEMKNRLEHDDVGKKLWADGFSDWVEGYIENECACSFVRAVKDYIDIYRTMPENENVLRLFDNITL